MMKHAVLHPARVFVTVWYATLMSRQGVQGQATPRCIPTYVCRRQSQEQAAPSHVEKGLLLMRMPHLQVQQLQQWTGPLLSLVSPPQFLENVEPQLVAHAHCWNCNAGKTTNWKGSAVNQALTSLDGIAHLASCLLVPAVRSSAGPNA